MKKRVTLILSIFILCTSYLSAAHIEVTNFSFDPQQPQPDEPVTILIRLANKSYDQDMEVTCRLFIDSVLHDVKVVPVTRRSSSGVSFIWTAQPGDHIFSLEMSYYIDRIEYTTNFFQYLTVPGGEEEIDFYSEALRLFNNGSFIQAKLFFEQAKRVFEENQDMEQALVCEEYILQCNQYIEAIQKFEQAEKAYKEKDFITALPLYQQASSLFSSLDDSKAVECEERIQEIQENQENQRKKANRIYYIVFSLPVLAAVIAFLWLRRKPPPSPLPHYAPEKRVKRLFNEEPEPEIVKELHTIESRLDTKDPQTFKSLVKDFKKQEVTFDKKEYSPQEAELITENLKTVKEELREKGKKLQDIEKLKDINRRCDMLLDQPMGDLVDAYNTYAQLHNVFDQIPYLGIPEQDQVKAKLKEYYQFIQEKAKSQQSERQ